VIRTRFTEMLGLTAPVMSAPMAQVTGAPLAAAVSSAGGLGTFGGINMKGPDWIREEMATIRAQTDRPFAVGFITHFLSAMPELFDAALEAHAPVIVLSFAPVGPWLRRAHEAGARVVCQVQTMDLVEDALAEEADAIVVQGHEAGGHTGTMGLLPFLARVLEMSGDTPVLAAGGIANGRGLAAVVAAGADGVSVGTALLATPEAMEVPDAYKKLIVDSSGEDTVFTTLFDTVAGVPWPEPVGLRTRRTPHTDAWQGRQAEIEDHIDELRAELPPLLDLDHFDPAVSPALYGQSAACVGAVRPAAEVVDTLQREAEALLRRRVAQVLDPR
jgi:nitronate monooxygenase